MTSCASLTGSAFYRYQKVGEDCIVTIDSGRVMKAGASLEIDGCDIKVTAQSLEQGGSSVADVNILLATFLQALKPIPSVEKSEAK